MANPLNTLIRYVSAAALCLTLAAAANTAEASDIRHTVAQTDLCRVNPIRHAPLRASKDAVINADLKLRAAIGAEVRARSQREAAEERYAELQASFAPRKELKTAKAYSNWARIEHRLTVARLEQAEARRVLHSAELELGKLQLMESYELAAAHRYRASRFEDQFDDAMWDFERVSTRVERLEKRILSAKNDWEALATR